MPQTNVVITGLGVVSSIGIGCDAFCQSLMAKRSGIRSLAERTDGHAQPGTVTEPAGLWIGGPVVDFDPKQFVRPRKALKVMCREIQLAFAASQLAIEHSGLAEHLPAETDRDIKPSEVGTVFGSEMFYGLPTEMEDAVKNCTLPDGTISEARFGAVAMRDVMPLWMLKYLPNMPACHVGIAINAHGPNNTLVLGDVSGPAAMIEAASCLERDIARLMITGSVGTLINSTRMNYRGNAPIPEAAADVALSSRPHDPNSVGVVGGEASATMILESPDVAAARQATPIARIRAYARRFAAPASAGMSASTDASRGTNGQPPKTAIELALQSAIADAGLSASDIGLLVSSAAGHPELDAAERAAVRRILPDVTFAAPAAAIGHTGAATGSIGLAVGALAVSQRLIPPTVNAESSAAPMLTEPAPLPTDHVACLSHTPEGIAVVVILSSAES